VINNSLATVQYQWSSFESDTVTIFMKPSYGFIGKEACAYYYYKNQIQSAKP